MRRIGRWFGRKFQSPVLAANQGGPSNAWSLVLAGGNGNRLQSLTLRIDGDSRPKQFSSIYGRRTMLGHTRERLRPLFPEKRTLFVVTREHESFYRQQLADTDESQVLVQPMNRGTGVAVILGLLRVFWRDPNAIIAVFPADHFYADDRVFRATVRGAIAAARRHPDRLVLVGAEPRTPEVEYGWIEAGPPAENGDPSLSTVRRFWEKPRLEKARELMARGSLWNTFITVGQAGAFLELLTPVAPMTLAEMASALFRGELEDVYRSAPTLDLSRDVLTSTSHRLLVLRDGASGWTDFGSPQRVVDTLVQNGLEPDWLRVFRDSRPPGENGQSSVPT